MKCLRELPAAALSQCAGTLIEMLQQGSTRSACLKVLEKLRAVELAQHDDAMIAALELSSCSSRDRVRIVKLLGTLPPIVLGKHTQTLLNSLLDTDGEVVAATQAIIHRLPEQQLASYAHVLLHTSTSPTATFGRALQL